MARTKATGKRRKKKRKKCKLSAGVLHATHGNKRITSSGRSRRASHIRLWTG